MSSGTRVRPSGDPAYTSTRDVPSKAMPAGSVWKDCGTCGRSSMEEFCPKHRVPEDK